MSNLALYVACALIWGSTWIAINFQLGEVATEVSISYRYLLASVLLFIWCSARGQRLRYPLRHHLLFVAMGVLLFGLNYIATYHAQLYISSALNAVAFSTLVWMNIVHARIFFGTRMAPRVLIGSALGMAGIIAMFWPQIGEISFQDSVLTGAALCLTGALLASWGNMVSQQAQRQALPVMPSNAWGMLYGALLTAGIAWRNGNTFDFDPSLPYVTSLLYLAVFGSIFAFGAYLTLLGRIGSERAGYVVLMYPVVALLLSTWFEGLRLTPSLLMGMALVSIGNVLVLVKPERLARLRFGARLPTPAKEVD